MTKNHNTDIAIDATKSYDNNPLLIAIRGIERLFIHAKPAAWALLVASLLLVLFNLSSMFAPTSTDTSTTSQSETVPGDGSFLEIAAIAPLGLAALLAVIGITLLVILVVGVIDYIAAAAANGRNVTVSEAFAATFKHFWPYLLMRLLVIVKILLWSLLFILPGIYFAYRYALSGVVFFSENKQSNAAIKRSLQLTKGAWLTTFISYGLLNLLTFGAIQMLADTGTSSELYRNYRTTVDAGRAHPGAHIASWLLLIFVVTIFALFIFAGVLFGIGSAIAAGV